MPPSVALPIYHPPQQPVYTAVHLPPHAAQINFLGVEGLQINYDDTHPRTFDSAPLISPAAHDFRLGNIYRLKLSNIPGYPGRELFPTLEVAPLNAKTHVFLANNSVPVELTDCDFEHVFSGNFVTKVVYLPNPEFQGIAMSGVATLSSKQLLPGVNPIIEASKRGSILAVIRMGNREMSRTAQKPDEQIDGEWWRGSVPLNRFQ